MSVLRKTTTLIAVLVALTGLSTLGAQEKELTAGGKVQVGLHRLKLQAGNLYLVKVEGNGFRPNVHIRPGNFIYTTQLDMGDTVQSFFVAPESKEHRLTVLPEIYDDFVAGALDYTVTVKPVPLAEQPLLSEKAKLTPDDPVYKSEDSSGRDSVFKPFPLKLKAKQIYIMDMEVLDRSARMDPYLMLEDAEGKIVASDDDGGNGNSARLVFQPRREGEYRLIATTTGKGFGNFSLIVRSQK